jgi:hypothetical protein
MFRPCRRAQVLDLKEFCFSGTKAAYRWLVITGAASPFFNQTRRRNIMQLNFKQAALAAVLALAGAAAHASVIATNSSYGAIDGGTATRIFSIGQHGAIEDVNLTIEFSKCDDPRIGATGTSCVGIGDAYENEISFTLANASGVTVTLVPAQKFGHGAGIGRVRVTFDDEAASALGGRVAAGSFRPTQLLSAFDGRDMFGNWTLSIGDANGSDPLEFFSATLELNASAASIPEPATPAILGLGLLGIGAARRRARG